MVKGVNKNVIEITQTGSDCFERAILFVRADRQQLGGEQLNVRARDFLSRLRTRPSALVRRRFWPGALKLLSAFSLGLAVAFLWFSVYSG